MYNAYNYSTVQEDYCIAILCISHIVFSLRGGGGYFLYIDIMKILVNSPWALYYGGHSDFHHS
jgi:hypothetical protein